MCGRLAIVSLCCAVGAIWAAAAGASDYIGARRCKACHTAEYDDWRQTAHSRAFQRLDPAQQRDPRCITCHATSAEDGLHGVECESCHGPGRYYWPEYVMKDAELARAVGLRRGDEPDVCRGCHTADSPSMAAFDFAASLRRVSHRAAHKEGKL